MDEIVRKVAEAAPGSAAPAGPAGSLDREIRSCSGQDAEPPEEGGRGLERGRRSARGQPVGDALRRGDADRRRRHRAAAAGVLQRGAGVL